MKKKITGALLAGALTLGTLSGCVDAEQAQQQDLKDNSIGEEMVWTEQSQKRLNKVQPPPQLDYSLERANLTKRLERWNDENKVSYIYLMSYGQVVSHYTIKGKVSSVNSKLSTNDQVVRTHAGGSYQTVESPDFDGSYGSNGDAVFFFTTDDTYVEWSGNYVLMDKPMKVNSTVQLTKEVE